MPATRWTFAIIARRLGVEHVSFLTFMGGNIPTGGRSHEVEVRFKNANLIMKKIVYTNRER